MCLMNIALFALHMLNGFSEIMHLSSLLKHLLPCLMKGYDIQYRQE